MPAALFISIESSPKVCCARCRGGISHLPDGHVMTADAARAYGCGWSEIFGRWAVGAADRHAPRRVAPNSTTFPTEFIVMKPSPNLLQKGF
jgi:hypothetical protein